MGKVTEMAAQDKWQMEAQKRQENLRRVKSLLAGNAVKERFNAILGKKSVQFCASLVMVPAVARLYRRSVYEQGGSCAPRPQVQQGLSVRHEKRGEIQRLVHGFHGYGEKDRPETAAESLGHSFRRYSAGD